MSVVVLASGGLDSTVVSLLATDVGQKVYPLFVDYGQRAAVREWRACVAVHKRLRLPSPKRADLAGFGKIARSGLTDRRLDIVSDAFTPGRNAMLLLAGASHAFCVGARAVALGLLDEGGSFFPDQKQSFLRKMELAIEAALGLHVKVIAPLMHLNKADVLRLAREKGVLGTYSCHAGGIRPCGQCISCTELLGAKNLKGGRRHGRRIGRKG